MAPGSPSSRLRRHRADAVGEARDAGDYDGERGGAAALDDAAKCTPQHDGVSPGTRAALDALPPLHRQFTLRGALLGAGCSLLFCAIALRLSLGSAGIVPSINAPAGLLSFLVLKAFSSGGHSMGLRRGLFAPLTVQETTVVQTYVTSACNVVFTGGFSTWLTAMSYQASLNTGGAARGEPGYDPATVIDPAPGRVIPFVLLTSFLGIFAIVALRKLIIIDWQLPFPSGTATGIMLNSFFSTSGQASAVRKIRVLLWTAGGSFLFELFKWFWQGADYSCGFGTWPTFGFEAAKWTFFFDWNQSYIGSGMICPPIVDWSMMLGAIISWGVMWPLLKAREGDWYPAGLSSRDFKGLFGFKVFLMTAMTMGEGVYMLGHAMAAAWRDASARLAAARAARAERLGGAPRAAAPAASAASGSPLIVGGGGGEGAAANGGGAADGGGAEKEALLEFKETPEERELRGAVFAAGSVPWWFSPAGYAVGSVLAVGLVPLIYPPVRWYFVLVALLLAPLMALPNAYGCGLVDWDGAATFGKLALFAFAGWAGKDGGGLISGLGICGVVLSCCSAAAVMMQGFRTGYITTTSPRTMIAAQAIGALMGCFLAPLAFFLIWSTGQVGIKEGPYSNPFGDVYRSMAVLGAEGFGALPKHCALLMGVLFAASLAICGARDALPRRYARFVPSPMAMGIPFYLGANNALNFWLGALIVHAWEWRDAAGADAYAAVAGSGLLIGGGVFSLPAAILALAGAAPPVCMSFAPGAAKGGAR